MTPAEFMDEIVVPTLSEFRYERNSRRRAYLTCIAAFHLKDYLKEVGEKGIEAAMRSECGVAFDIVRSICNGTKHAQTDGSHVFAFKAGDDTERQRAMWSEAKWDESQWGDSHGGREVRHGDGRLDVYECAKAVIVAYQRLYLRHLSGCDLGQC